MGLCYSKQRHKPRITKAQIPWLLRGAIRSNNVETLHYLLIYPNKVNPSMVIDGVCPLNLAIELGHLKMVKILIKAGADIHVADAPRYPLHQASISGRGPIAELLIRSGASVTTLTERRQSCLHLLCHQSAERFIETAHLLMQSGTNPNTLDDDGLAPLHRASVGVASALLSYDVTDVNIISRDGDTPLLTAVKDRRDSVVVALLQADQNYQERFKQKQTQTQQQTHSCFNVGIDEKSDEAGCLPLRTSSSKSTNSAALRLFVGPQNSLSRPPIISTNVIRASSAASVNLLLSVMQRRTFRTSIHSSTSKQETNKSPLKQQQQPLSGAMANAEVSTTFFNRLSAKQFKSIRPEPASVHQQAWVRQSVTTASIGNLGSANRVYRKTENCQRCHSVGAPGDISGWRQSCDRLQRFLTKATLTVQPTMTSDTRPKLSVQLCSRPPLDLNARDKIGMTPLMIAAEAGNTGLPMTVALVNAGCDVALTDKVGMTALHHVCYVGSLNAARFLLENVQVGSNASLLSVHSGPLSQPPTPYAAETRRTVMLDSLDAQDKYGRTPIYLAACRGHTQVVRYLLSLNSDFHLPNKEHKSPLYISAYFGYLEIVNALLRAGAQVDQKDSHRKTPLYVATYHGRSEIVDLLVDAGANVNAADQNGKTPLYVAVLHGHLALAQKLLTHGALVNRVDCEGLGPLHMAVKFPKLDIPMVKLLLSYGCDPVNLASFTRWLLMHGIIPHECIHGDDELAYWLHSEESNVKSLRHICRAAIQRTLGNTDSVRFKLRKLPLPEHLISYVSRKEL